MKDVTPQLMLDSLAPGLRPPATMLDGMDAEQRVTYLQKLGATTPTTQQIAAAMSAKRAAAEAGHRGGVTTARKQRMGIAPKADPAGKRWKPAKTGPLDKAIFPRWGKVPVYIPPLARHMNRAMLATVVVIGEEVDRTGRFVLARATHAEKAGCAPGKAYDALQVFKAAGLIEVDIQGDRAQATVWRYRPVAAVDLARAARVLQKAKQTATARVEKVTA